MTAATDLAEILETVVRPGDFVTSGSFELLPPSIEVEGVGPIALPLLPDQARQLVAVAEQAPYGKGPETRLDTSVRRTWQIGPERVRIRGKHWSATLKQLLTRIGEGLGVSDPIEAEFYKLLIYDAGSFFVGHRDTEKSPGMFATLVIVLPSVSSGGELVVRHRDRELHLPLATDDPSEAAFAAFYADCVHEVLPVTTGCRLTLVYSLLRRGTGKPPKPPDYQAEQDRVVGVLEQWRKETLGSIGAPPDEQMPEEWPVKLVWPLEHAYTQAELGFDALKGKDAAAANVLTGAARQAGYAIQLALLTVEESGVAEYLGDYGGRRGWSDDDDDDADFEIVEVSERAVALSDWRTPDGSPSAFTRLPVLGIELAPPDALEDLEPDEQHFREASGNEGASYERTYRRTALVLWPWESAFAVLVQGGLSVTLPCLADMVRAWEAAGGDAATPEWQQAHDLAGQMIAGWPHQRWSAPDQTESDAARMLGLLTRLADSGHVAAFLTQVTAAGAYRMGDNAAIMAALGLLPERQLAGAIGRIVAGTAVRSFEACADLLARAASARAMGDLHGAAQDLLGALPGDPAKDRLDPWSRGQPVTPNCVVALLRAFGAIDPAIADRALETMLLRVKTYDPDGILVPAARDMVVSPATRVLPVTERLRAACLHHLRTRIALPLAPPADWRRPNAVRCNCASCKQLSAFLDDPGQASWSLRAVAASRDHVAASIRESQCDLDTTTDQRGRPYILICRKNQASYERRARQRKDDLAAVAALGE